LREWKLVAYDKQIEIVPGVTVAYPWIRGESYEVEVMTSTGATVHYDLEEAQPGTRSESD
jgi:hypothetical protein